jgi:carbonic anhydrase
MKGKDSTGRKCKQLVYIGGKTFELLQFHFHNCTHHTYTSSVYVLYGRMGDTDYMRL